MCPLMGLSLGFPSSCVTVLLSVPSSVVPSWMLLSSQLLFKTYFEPYLLATLGYLPLERAPKVL